MDVSTIPTRAAIVTPSDTVPCNGCGLIYSGGTCKVLTGGGDTVTLPADFAGLVIPMQINMVFSTGTTATAILVFK